MEAFKGEIGEIESYLFGSSVCFWISGFFAIWPVGGRERVQNIRGGSGNISGYRELHSEDCCFSTFSADFQPSQTMATS